MVVLSLERLAESEQIDIQEQGIKTEGLVDLIRLKRELNLDYNVPDGFVVPVSGALPIEIKKALYDLTSTETDKVMLLARSSSPDEEPGKFTTVSVLFDPKDKQGSYERFLEAYRTVVGEEPKAVIGQKIVGEVTEKEGRNVFGLSNNSFILQAPSFHPDQIAITCARGLADRVVAEDSSKVFLIDYDFVNRELVRAVDRPDSFYEHHDGYGFRQTDAECFDSSTGEAITIQIERGRFGTNDFGRIGDSHRNRFASSFQDNEELERLVDAVLAIRENKGKAVEVEGAFVDGRLNLFQLRELEELPHHNIELSKNKYVVGGSEMVMGSGRFTIDMVWFSGIKRNVVADSVAGSLSRFLEDYEDRPFFAVVDHFHGALIEQLGDSCRIIGSECYENMQSHTVGVARKRIAEGDLDLYINQCALNVSHFTNKVRPCDREYVGGAVKVWENITIESDGRNAIMYFEDEDPETAGKYNLEGLDVISLEDARVNPENIRGKVIVHPEYDLAIKVESSGHGYTNLVHGRNYGGGGGSKEYSFVEIEEQFDHLIEFYSLEKKKPQIPTSETSSA